MARSLQWAVVSGFASVALLAMLPSACRAVAGLPGGEPYVDASPTSWDGARPVYPLCQEYCSNMLKSCGTSIYGDDDCWNACSVLKPGMPGDTTGNSVECRLTAAKRGNPEGCQAASPMSDEAGLCGDRCRNYCYFVKALCPDSFKLEFSDDPETCDFACRQVPQTENGEYSISPSSKENTLQCRFYHLISAAKKPEVHCPHALGHGACLPVTDMPEGGGQGGGGQGGAGQGGGGGEGGAAPDAGKTLDGGTTSDGGKTDGG